MANVKEVYKLACQFKDDKNRQLTKSELSNISCLCKKHNKKVHHASLNIPLKTYGETKRSKYIIVNKSNFMKTVNSIYQQDIDETSNAIFAINYLSKSVITKK